MKPIKRLHKLMGRPDSRPAKEAADQGPEGPRLDFGCGNNAKPGYVGVDIRAEPGVEYVCNAWEIVDHVDAASIAGVYSRHFLEHLTFPQAGHTIGAWRSILMPGGLLEILVPDIRYHIGQYLDRRPDNPSQANANWTVKQHAIAGFWGWQREGDDRLWDVHKSGYDEASLTALLLEHGFENVRRVENKPWHLHMRARKPH